MDRLLPMDACDKFQGSERPSKVGISPHLTVNVSFTLSSVVQSVTWDSTCRSSKNRVTLNKMLKIMTANTADLERAKEERDHFSVLLYNRYI